MSYEEELENLKKYKNKYLPTHLGFWHIYSYPIKTKCGEAYSLLLATVYSTYDQALSYALTLDKFKRPIELKHIGNFGHICDAEIITL